MPLLLKRRIIKISLAVHLKQQNMLAYLLKEARLW